LKLQQSGTTILRDQNKLILGDKGRRGDGHELTLGVPWCLGGEQRHRGDPFGQAVEAI
jgi:hypothetical protein